MRLAGHLDRLRSTFLDFAKGMTQTPFTLSFGLSLETALVPVPQKVAERQLYFLVGTRRQNSGQLLFIHSLTGLSVNKSFQVHEEIPPLAVGDFLGDEKNHLLVVCLIDSCVNHGLLYGIPFTVVAS